MSLTWSAWQPLPLTLSPAVVAETLDGGQSFRWNRQADGTWLGLWGDFAARISVTPGSGKVKPAPDATGPSPLLWSAPEAIADRVEPALRFYLSLDADVAGLTDALPWRSDAHLASCIKTFPGLRILRQPFGETLLCFLCSATKQITQIKQMTALLAERHGTEIAPSLHRLPAWADLARVSEADLRTCLLGFRARYIHETAVFLAAHPGWLEKTEAAPYAEARERLCSLPGVGEKVADCVLLFGAGRLEAFPVDVWILKSMERRYGLTGWRPAQVAQFGRTHFGPLAGLAQQYLFAYERAQRRPIARG